MKDKQESPRCGFLLILIEKIPNTMKLTLLFLVASLLSTTATASAQRVSIALNNAKVEKALAAITDQTGLSIAYSGQVVDLTRKVTLHFTNAELTLVLDKLGEGTSLGYEVKNGKIYLFDNQSNKALSEQEPKKVTGVVTDSKGEPIIGANVVEKGTTNGTVTDLDGNFSLDIVDQSLLQISYIGFNLQNVATTGKTHLLVSLKEDTQTLDEVVVVGYGTQKKVNLTGSVASITFDDEMANRPITNASQALSGKVSGVWVSQNSGKPGDDGAQLRIRGWGTLNNSNPLIIVDGVEGTFNQVNPSDIESITILKDAASAAIYGSKAANGVVLITTKMGENNEETQVSVTSYVGVQSLGRRFNLINNSAESMQLANKALTNVGSSPLFPDYLIENFQNGTDKYRYPNTDWFDVAFDNALIHEHNASIRGGTKKSTSFLSFNYLGQDGMLPNSKSERFGARANLDFNVKEWLKIGGRFNYMRRTSTEPYDLPRVFDMLPGSAPYIAPYTRDGRFGSVETISKDGSFLYDNRNVLIDAANGEKKATQDNLVMNLFADIDFTKDLKFKATWSTTATWLLTDKYNESIFGYTDSGVETITRNYNREGLEMIRDQVSTIQNNFHATLNYEKTFAKKHYLSLVAGMQLENFQVKNMLARRTGAPKEGLTQVDAGTTGIKGEGNMKGLRMFSYFGRINYSFADKYLFEANLRADASSRFKNENRWGVFPGFSAGWRLTEEGFMKNTNLFSNLKLRASWGQLGNQNIEGYWPYLTVIDQNYNLSYNYNGALSPGAAVTSLIDEDITWETTSSVDIGLDAGFLDNRITVELDYFKKKTTDIIVQLPIPLILGGIKAPFENVGEMVNNGVELTLNYDSKTLSRDQFGYNINLNLTYVNNEVTKFRGGKSPDQLYLIREGYSYNTLYGYKTTGIYQSDAEAAEHMHANGFKPKAGNLKFEDRNGDGKLGFEDKQALGNTIPKLTYGLTTNFSFKGFDLNLLFQGIAGANAFTKNSFTQLDYQYLTIPTFWRDAWSPENTNTHIPRLEFDSTWDNSESSFWVHRIDFLKLKNVQLGYLLPESVTSRLKIEKLYFYVNAQNVFTMLYKNGYEGYDPEKDAFSNGRDVYPTPRVVSFGVNLNF